MDGNTIRQRAKSFQDYYSQARMFWKRMSSVEADHIVAAFAFELGKVEVREIRSGVVDELNRVDHGLAGRVAAKLGLSAPAEEPVDDTMPASAALSQLNAATGGIAARKIAMLARRRCRRARRAAVRRSDATPRRDRGRAGPGRRRRTAAGVRR